MTPLSDAAMSVDHVARIRSALANTSPPRLAAGDALLSLAALEAQAAFWERRYKELRERWNAAVMNPDAMRRDRDLYLSKTVALEAENQRLREALAGLITLCATLGATPEIVADARAALAAVVEE